MKVVESLQELAEHDSAEAYPDGPQEPAIVSAIARIAEISGLPLDPEGPSDFQDGALFMCAQEYGTRRGRLRSDVLGGYYFSKFGRLFTGGRLSDKSAASEHLWLQMREALSREFGFTYVSDTLLRQPYNGSFKEYRCGTWSERYFCPWYRPHDDDRAAVTVFEINKTGIK